ncbi:alginate export [Leptospira fluminis]|uniref:Alginate export n=2 Tax=Leptospira fluminis TaxID=2484979 RepID=A0A4R9GPN4_9LEPT|nr:alginate export [Leptospira fluminis]
MKHRKSKKQSRAQKLGKHNNFKGLRKRYTYGLPAGLFSICLLLSFGDVYPQSVDIPPPSTKEGTTDSSSPKPLEPPPSTSPKTESGDPKPDPKKKPEESKYASPWKGDIPIDYLRTLLVSPEQMKDTQKSNLFWVDNLKIGFSVRPRYESRDHSNFSKRIDDYSSFVGQNTQLWFLLDPSPYFAIKVTIQDTRLWGGSQSAQNAGNWSYALTTGSGTTLTPGTATNTNLRNPTDIREAFITLKKSDKLPISVMIGRQVFAFGDLKLVGPLNWLNTGFSFDGIRFVHDSKWFRSHVFGTILSDQYDAPYGLTTSNGKAKGTIDEAYFMGMYNTIKGNGLFDLDLYTFDISKKWIANPNPPVDMNDARSKQRDDLITAGFRLTNRTNSNTLPAGKIWDWTIESAWQTGYTGDRVKADWDILNIQAPSGKNFYTQRVQYDTRFLSLDTGVKILDNVRLGGGYTFASGDPNRSDAKVGTWQTLFPQVAGSFPNWNVMNGQSLLVGFANIRTYSARLNIKTENYGTLIFTIYDTYKATPQDAWYKVSGVPNTGASTENYSDNKFTIDNGRLGKHLMYQYDFTWIYNYSEYVSIWSGFSLARAEDAIRNARNNPYAANPLDRNTFTPNSKFFYLMVSVSL